MADYKKPVVFKIEEEVFGVDINLVQSIEKQMDVVPVPNSVSYVKGIINLRGEVVPVYSLKQKFGMQNVKPSDSSIIINASGVKIALEVDAVMEIDEIDPDHIVSMPAMVKKEDTQYLDRVANVNGKLIILLDVNELLSADETESVKQLAEKMQE